MTISRHTSTLVMGGRRYDPVDLSLALDEGSVPFARLSATLPLDENTGAELDPRVVEPVTVSLRQDFGEGETVAALTSSLPSGATVADLSYRRALTPVEGFEDGTLGKWSPDENTTASVVTFEPYSGTYCVELGLVGGEIGNDGIMMIGYEDLIPLDDAPVMVRMRQVAEINPQFSAFSIEYYDADEVLMTTYEDLRYEQMEEKAVGWELGFIPVSQFMPEDAAYAKVWVGAETPNLQGQRKVWFDDISIIVVRNSLASLSAEFGEPYNSFGMRQSSRRRASLHLRSRKVDHAAGTVRVESASGESLLADYALSETSPVATGTTVRAIVNAVLGRVLGESVSTPDTGDVTVEAEAQTWRPGETAWSYLQSITGMAGLRLWCDEVGIWHLQDPEIYRALGGVSMGPDQATTLSDTLGRESAGWADSAVVEYQWTDSNGDRRTRYDVTAPGTRTITRTVDRPYPGRGFADAIARKARARGREVAIGGVSDYDIEPLQAALLTIPGAMEHHGIVSGIQWQQPGDVMTLRTRDLMGVEPQDWLYLSPNLSWDNEPEGGSWTDEEVS